MNWHRQRLFQARIWFPYFVHAYCVGSIEAASLAHLLSGEDAFINSLFQNNINHYLKVSVCYFLFPLLNSQYQSQAVAKLICETLPDAKHGELYAWVDTIQVDELNSE